MNSEANGPTTATSSAARVHGAVGAGLPGTSLVS